MGDHLAAAQPQPLLGHLNPVFQGRDDPQAEDTCSPFEQQVTGEAVVDRMSLADLLGEGRLDQGQVDVLLVAQRALRSRGPSEEVVVEHQVGVSVGVRPAHAHQEISGEDMSEADA